MHFRIMIIEILNPGMKKIKIKTEGKGPNPEANIVGGVGRIQAWTQCEQGQWAAGKFYMCLRLYSANHTHDI